MTWKDAATALKSVRTAILRPVRATWTWIKDKLETWKGKAATLQSIATIIALILGGWWTYKNFIQFRQDRPRVAVTHSVRQFQISGGRVLLAVSERLTNEGVVDVRPPEGLIRIDQVLPIPASVEDKWKNTSTDPYPDTEDSHCVKLPEKGALNDTATNMCVWPVVAFHMHRWTKDNPLLLEPGEQDTILNFFIIPDTVQVVYIYSSIRNPREGGLAWHAVTIYDLRASSPVSASP